MLVSSTLQKLLGHLSTGALLILPSPRAAAGLRSAFDQQQRARGLAAWEPARAISWQQWIAGLWSELVLDGVETRLLLNETQEHALWREIVSDAPDTLVSSDSLADLARSAFHLAASYNALHRLEAAANTHDSRIFAEWSAEFIQQCQELDLLSPSLLHEALSLHLANHTLKPPPDLHLGGFLDFTPAQQSLLDKLQSQGTKLVHHSFSMEPQTASRPATLRSTITAENQHEELALALRWIRQFLAEPSALPIPPSASLTSLPAKPKSVALLIPNLSEKRAELESALREHIAPELQSITADLSSTPWEFSSGIPFPTLPLIQTALALVQWAAGPLSLEHISSLLLSPYVGSATDRDLAARFDAYGLRRFKPLRPESDLASILERSATFSKTPPPAWLRNLQQFLTRANLTAPRSFADWTDMLRDLVHTAGWPGPRQLNAVEFEATQTFQRVLDAIATLDFSGRRVPFSTALHALERQLHAAPFQPPATHAPIQVMSPEESIGSFFDAVLFLDATDTNWPRPARANPLIAWPLQRSLRMPGTDAALTNENALRLTQDLLTRSGHALFFTAAEDADGKLRPSPLLQSLNLKPLLPAELLPAPGPITPIALESIPDTTPLPPLPDAQIKGGSRVLQLQAACGFRAFAEFRLQAKEIDDFTIGLDAPESGARLHLALRNFWQEVRTQQALRNLSTEERDRILRQSVEEAISQHLRLQNTWDEAYIALQTQRMNTLLQQWLEVELQRGPFSVLTSEHKENVTIGPLTLELRFDRIDRVENAEGTDGFVLVDYKTGLSGHPKDWFGDRPDDPQLPLYALPYQDGELQGLTFAKVRAGEMKWLGLQSSPEILPASHTNEVVDLTELVENWRAILHRLALEFAAGRAEVNPKDYPATCHHCAQRLLCRLDPSSLLIAMEEEATEENDG